MKKILCFILIFQISFIPYNSAKAFVPLAVAAPVAIDAVGSFAVRFLAEELAIKVIASTITNSVRFSNAARIGYSAFATWLKSNAKSLVGGTAIAGALGFAFTNQNTLGLVDSQPDENGVYATQGFYWWASGSKAETPQQAAQDVCSLSDGCEFTNVAEVEPDRVKYELYELNQYWVDSADCTEYDTTACNYEKYKRMKSIYVIQEPCTSDDSGFSTCQLDYTAPVREATEQEIIDDFIKKSASVLTQEQQQNLYTDSNGQIFSELAGQMQVEELPTTLSGSELPLRGDPLWVAANSIVGGVAQSDDQNLENYVPAYMWDEAYYLGNTVANGNGDITEWNADVTTDNSGSDSDSNSGSVGTGEVTDSINDLDQNLSGQLDKINNTDVSIITSPDKNIAASFWDVRYPNGISGVLTDFIDNIKSTDLFNWLNGFNVDVAQGSEPVFELCFNTIANIDFGCYSLRADSYIWTAINALMILFAVIVSRRIVFGG